MRMHVIIVIELVIVREVETLVVRSTATAQLRKKFPAKRI